MTIHKISTCQADQQIPLKNKEGDGGKKTCARPKDAYKYERVPHDDESTTMSTLPKEKSGLPSKDTEETSFIKGTPSEQNNYDRRRTNGNEGG